jgi:hypothetical protein
MQPDEMRKILKEWGIATVNRYCYTRGDRSIHVLSQVRDMQPKTKEDALRPLIPRDGSARRRLMAAGIPWDKPGNRMEMVPMWAAEPIRASNDACPPADLPEIAVDAGIPDHLIWVERELISLKRAYPMRELVVRTEYTVSASQAVKVNMVKDEYDGDLTLRQYRMELEKSIDWFVYRMAA